MEQCVGMQVGADALGQFQFPVGQVLNQIVHLIGVFHIAHQSFLDGHQVMTLLEQAGRNEGSLVSLGSVYCVIHCLGGIPQTLRELQGRSLYIVLPVLNVLQDDLVGSMYGEGTGNIGGEGVGNAPGVNHIRAALFHRGGAHQIGMNQKGDCLVLVDKTIGVSATNDFTHVFFCSQHKFLPPYEIGKMT